MPVRERGLLEKAREAFTNMHEEHLVDMWSKKVPGSENSKCKGPEVGIWLLQSEQEE